MTNYSQKINTILKSLKVSYKELAEELKANEISLRTTVKNLDRPNRKNKPLGWTFAIWLFDRFINDKKCNEDENTGTV